MASEPSGDVVSSAQRYAADAAQRGVRDSQGVPASGSYRRQQWQQWHRSTGTGAGGAGGGKGEGAGKGAGTGEGAGKGAGTGCGRPGDDRKGKPGDAGFRCGFCGASDHRQGDCELRLEQQLSKAVAGLLRVKRDAAQVQHSCTGYVRFYSSKYGLQATVNADAVHAEPQVGTAVNAVQAAPQMQGTVSEAHAGAQAQADRAVQGLQRAIAENKRKKKEEAERKKEEKKQLVERKREERKAKAAAKARERRAREQEKEEKEREKEETEKRLRQQLYAEVRKSAARERKEEMAEMKQEMKRELASYRQQIEAAKEMLREELTKTVHDGILTVIGRVNICEDKVEALVEMRGSSQVAVVTPTPPSNDVDPHHRPSGHQTMVDECVRNFDQRRQARDGGWYTPIEFIELYRRNGYDERANDLIWTAWNDAQKE